MTTPDPPAPDTAAAAPWLSLTDLGRIYGISAVHCGRLLSDLGLRQVNGAPSPRALNQGLAYRHHPHGRDPSAVWHQQGCASLLEGQELQPMAKHRLVHQWADLLAALVQGAPAISTSAEDMAGDLPAELVKPVNQELKQRGCSFQVRRRASACRRARSSSARS